MTPLVYRLWCECVGAGSVCPSMRILVTSGGQGLPAYREPPIEKDMVTERTLAPRHQHTIGQYYHAVSTQRNNHHAGSCAIPVIVRTMTYRRYFI